MVVKKKTTKKKPAKKNIIKKKELDKRPPAKKKTPPKKLKTIKPKTQEPKIELPKKKRAGQPSKFKKEYVELVYLMAKEFGAIDKKLGIIFHVSQTTIDNWKECHPEFLASIKKGKDEHDCMNVEASLLQRALGYCYSESEFRREKPIENDDGTITPGAMVLFRKLEKQMAPDPQSAMYWLQNRNPERWKYLKYVDPGKGLGEVDWKNVGKDFTKAVKGLDMSKPEEKK
jgi:hypothetical protein